MLSNPDRVVVTSVGYSVLAIHASAVHHRDFPEVQGEGDSPEDAAHRLEELLTRTLDSAPSDWRRENIERAIEDVRAFAARSNEGHALV
jgi:hypothetical protein